MTTAKSINVGLPSSIASSLQIERMLVLLALLQALTSPQQGFNLLLNGFFEFS